MFPKLETEAEAVIHFMEQMDIDMLDTILDNNRTYQDLPKRQFIHKLGIAFDEFRNGNCEKLESAPGFCNSNECENACKNGQTFRGNGMCMNLIFEVKDGRVLDIFECMDFEVFDKSLKLHQHSQVFIDYTFSFRPEKDDFDIF